ncbi:hypothetical protein ACWN84_06060, partial [Pediococcus ethanolidurans]
FDLFWRLNRSTKRTDVLFYFSDFQNRQKTGISYSPIPESVDPIFFAALRSCPNAQWKKDKEAARWKRDRIPLGALLIFF